MVFSRLILKAGSLHGIAGWSLSQASNTQRWWEECPGTCFRVSRKQMRPYTFIERLLVKFQFTNPLLSLQHFQTGKLITLRSLTIRVRSLAESVLFTQPNLTIVRQLIRDLFLLSLIHISEPTR